MTPLYTCVYYCCFTTTMGTARGPWSPNYINSIMCPPFCQFYKKVVLRVSEHGDVIQTQTIRIVPLNCFSKLGPCLAHLCSNMRSFGSKCIVLKKVLVTLLGLYGAPHSISATPEWFGARGIAPPCIPRYAPADWTIMQRVKSYRCIRLFGVPQSFGAFIVVRRPGSCARCSPSLRPWLLRAVTRLNKAMVHRSNQRHTRNLGFGGENFSTCPNFCATSRKTNRRVLQGDGSA